MSLITETINLHAGGVNLELQKNSKHEILDACIKWKDYSFSLTKEELSKLTMAVMPN